MKKYSCDCNIIHEENVYNTKEKIKKLKMSGKSVDEIKEAIGVDSYIFDY